MLEIWEECARFKITSQRLTEHARAIIKKGWFSDLEISEIHQQTNRELCKQVFNIRIKMLNTEKQQPSNLIEM